MLRYPNARLLVHNMLVGDGLSGAQAIVESSVSCGLIKSSVNDCLQNATSEGGKCRCMYAAKSVVFRHFEEKPGANDVNCAQVWAAVESDFARVFVEGGACLKHAPALMDMMLQQIMRYP